MKGKICILLASLLMMAMCFAGCGGPITEEEIFGDYGAFEIDDYAVVELSGDKGKYVSMDWSLTDPDEGIVTFTYVITDDNIMNYDEDFWTEYHEEGFIDPQDALEEHFYDIVDEYEVPPEGDYRYVRSEKKLVSVDYGTEYYKKD